jgi:hypothetical protein
VILRVRFAPSPFFSTLRVLQPATIGRSRDGDVSELQSFPQSAGDKLVDLAWLGLAGLGDTQEKGSLGRRAADPKARGRKTESGDNAPVLEGELGVARDRSRRREM